MSDIKVYPSGFMGSAQVAQTDADQLESIRQQIFNVAPAHPVQTYTANLEVSRLWQAVVSGEPHVNGFDFHEEVLKAAMKAFGTRTINEWIDIQVNSSTCTDYHRNWIDETLRLVISGFKREYSYNVWYGLIKSGQARLGHSDLMRELFGRQGAYGGMTLPEFIQAWCSRENGIKDLLESLFLLFGKR